MVKAMCEDATTGVKCKDGLSESFEVKVGVQQGLKLSSLLFVTVLDVLSEETRRSLPWEMLYSDDLVICADDEKSLQENVCKWQSCMERRRLHVNAANTEVMVCSKERENVNILDRHNNQLKQMEAFKYLGSTLTETGSCQAEVAARVDAAWCKWRELTPVICDKKILARLTAKVYKSMVRPVLLYGAETWVTKETDMKLLEKTEMRVLRWIRGVSLKGHVRSKRRRAELGVAQRQGERSKITMVWACQEK